MCKSLPPQDCDGNAQPGCASHSTEKQQTCESSYPDLIDVILRANNASLQLTPQLTGGADGEVAAPVCHVAEIGHWVDPGGSLPVQDTNARPVHAHIQQLAEVSVNRCNVILF